MTETTSVILNEIARSGYEPINLATEMEIKNAEERLLRALTTARRLIDDVINGIDGTVTEEGAAMAFHTVRTFADGARASGTAASNIADALSMAARLTALVTVGIKAADETASV